MNLKRYTFGTAVWLVWLVLFMVGSLVAREGAIPAETVKLLKAYDSGQQLSEKEMDQIRDYLDLVKPAPMKAGDVTPPRLLANPVLSEDFSTGALPAGWTVTDDSLNGEVWQFDNPGARTLNSTTGANGFAIFDSDNYGNNGLAESSAMISPTIDCSALSQVFLQFEHYYRHLGSSAEVAVSVDDGATWQVLETFVVTTNNAEAVEYNITGIAAGESQVKIRWTYRGDWSWYWMVDDVVVAEPALNYSVLYVPDGGNPNGINTTGDTDPVSNWDTLADASQDSNNWSAAQAIPFPFVFYGDSVTHLKASQNGLVTFDTSATLLPNANQNLPTDSLPPMTIAAFWDEFTASPPTGSNDRIVTREFGTAPNRQFWIKYYSFEMGNPNTSFAYWALVLEETSNTVYVVDMWSSGSLTATVGLQLDNATSVQSGDSLLNYDSSNGSSNTDNDYYQFFLPSGDDIAMAAVSVQSSGIVPYEGESFPIQAILQNQGANDATNFDVTYMVDDGATNTFTYTDVLASGQEDTVTFPVNWTPASGGTFEVSGYVTFADDGNAANDSAFTTIDVYPVGASGYEQDFAGYSGNPSSIFWFGADNQPFGTFTPSLISDGSWTSDGFGNDGTSGSARFNLFGSTSTDSDWLISVPIDLSTGGSTPVVQFDAAVTPFSGTASDSIPETDTIMVVVSTDGTTWDRANVVGMLTRDDGLPPTGRTVSFDLSAYATETRLHIAFLALDNPDGADVNFYIDNVFVGVPPSVDVAVTDLLNVPGSVLGNTLVNFDVEVSNLGLDPVPSGNLDILQNGAVVSTVTYAALNPGDIDTVAADFTTSASGIDTVTAALQTVAGDADLSNDSLSATVVVLSPIPVPWVEMWDTTVIDPTIWPEVVGGVEVIDSTGVSTGTFPYPVPSEPYFVSINNSNTSLTSGIFDLSGQANLSLSMFESEHDLEPGENVVLEYLNSSAVWDTLFVFEGTDNGFGVFEPFERVAFGLPADAYHSGFKFRFTTEGALASTDEWFFDNITIDEVNDVAASRVAAPVLTHIPTGQPGILSAIGIDGVFANIGGSANTGDLSVAVTDTAGASAYSNTVAGVTINPGDSLFTVGSWDASAAATGDYGVSVYTENFTDSDASNDTASFAVNLGDVMAYDNGVQSTSGTFSSSARSQFGVKFSLTDSDTLTGATILVTEFTADTDSFAVQVWEANADTPTVAIHTIAEGVYGDLGARPVLATFEIPDGLVLPAGDFFIVFDMKGQTFAGGSFPCGIDFTAQGANNVPSTFWGKIVDVIPWTAFENAGAGTWTPVMRAEFRQLPPSGDQVVFSDDFESGAGNWNLEGTWGLATNEFNSPSTSLSESPVGNYGDNLNISATMANGVDLSSALGAKLSFFARYDIEQGFDYMYIEASSDGTNWLSLGRFDGQDLTWQEYEFQLGGFLGNPDVKVRFRFFSDVGFNLDGMYIDDVMITTTDVDTVAPAIVHNGPFLQEGADGDFVRTAQVIDVSGIASTEIPYQVDNDTVMVAPSDSSDGNTFYYTIPDQDAGANVAYQVSATDGQGNAGITEDVYEYVAGTHLFYDNGVTDFVNQMNATMGAAVRITVPAGFEADLAHLLIRNYTDQNRPNDAMEVHVWADNNGIPGADLITPLPVIPEATLDNTSPMTRIDMRPFASQLENLTGDFFIGFTVPATALNGVWVTQTTPAIANRTFVLNGPGGAGWVLEADDFHFRAVVELDTIQVGIGETALIPTEYTLEQNYPNPFNPTTTIKYGLKAEGQVKLQVYNVLGQLVRTLVDARQTAGFREIAWDGTNEFGAKVASGIYIYRLEAENFVKSRKMILMK